MDAAALYLKAIGFGLAVAAPVGPMSLLCMRRTLAFGWRGGMATGLGIATGDGLYALVAALGLAGVSHFMLAHERPLHVAAGLFLVYLGLRGMLRRGGDAPSPALADGWPHAWLTAVLLTLTNPPTIIMFAAILAALAPAAGFEAASALPTVAGIFTGSLLWWLGLTGALARLRHVIGPGARRWIDRLAGGLLALLGVAELRRAL